MTCLIPLRIEIVQLVPLEPNFFWLSSLIIFQVFYELEMT
jgi:hypothetical protein